MRMFKIFCFWSMLVVLSMNAELASAEVESKYDADRASVELREGQTLSELLADGQSLLYSDELANDLVANPYRYRGAVPAELLRVLADRRMKLTVAALVRKLRHHNQAYPELEFLESNLQLHIIRVGDDGFMWISMDADDRGSSAFQSVVAFDLISGKVKSWGRVEFVDHP